MLPPSKSNRWGVWLVTAKNKAIGGQLGQYTAKSKSDCWGARSVYSHKQVTGG